MRLWGYSAMVLAGNETTFGSTRSLDRLNSKWPKAWGYKRKGVGTRSLWLSPPCHLIISLQKIPESLDWQLYLKYVRMSVSLWIHNITLLLVLRHSHYSFTFTLFTLPFPLHSLLSRFLFLYWRSGVICKPLCSTTWANTRRNKDLLTLPCPPSPSSTLSVCTGQ